MLLIQVELYHVLNTIFQIFFWGTMFFQNGKNEGIIMFNYGCNYQIGIWL